MNTDELRCSATADDPKPLGPGRSSEFIRVHLWFPCSFPPSPAQEAIAALAKVFLSSHLVGTHVRPVFARAPGSA